MSFIIPTLHQGTYLEDLLKQIEKLKLHSYEIIVIEDKLVNEARNEWVAKAKWKYIFVLNDDIIIYNDTFDKMKEALKYATVAWPYFKRWLDDPKIHTHNGKNIVWFCFAFKQEDKDKLFPIDERLKLWYWDNRIYHKANKRVWWWWFIYHRESKTLLDDKRKDECMQIIARDKDKRLEIQEENWRC